MPLYLSEASWDRSAPLADTLSALELSVQRSGGQLLQALQVDGGLSLTLETPDDLSLYRISREASELGLELRTRVALARVEAESLDAAHRLRKNEEQPDG